MFVLVVYEEYPGMLPSLEASFASVSRSIWDRRGSEGIQKDWQSPLWPWPGAEAFEGIGAKAAEFGEVLRA